MNGRHSIEPLGALIRRSIAIALICAAARLCPQPAAVAAPKKGPSESDVKAADLFNFGKFVRFAGPAAQRQRTFDICILGRDQIGRAIDEIAGNASIDGRAVHVRRISDPSAGRSCAILFVSADEGAQIREDLAVIRGANVLTVSDAPDFLESGGMIQFVLQGDRVRFEVNLDAVDRAHLVLSSELLRVAAAVHGKQEEPR